MNATTRPNEPDSFGAGADADNLPQDTSADLKTATHGTGANADDADIKPGAFPSHIPFLSDMGVEFLGMANGEASVALNLEQRHMNSWHVTHGGVVMTLMDVVMAMAGRSLEPEARGGVTVEMKTSFLQPAGKPGQRLVAKGKAFHRSATLCFCDGELWDGDRLVAKAMGTFKFLKRPDTGRKLEQL